MDRVALAFLVSKAFVFAQTAAEKGYKYKRAVTCLGSVLEALSKDLTENEKRMLIRKVERLGKRFYMEYYDYLDCLNEAIKRMHNNKYKYLSGCVALASNVEAMEDDESNELERLVS